MRVLLDECMPRRLKRYIVGHSVATVQETGWAGVKNGDLIRLIAADGSIDAFVTVDRGMEYQQNFTRLPFAVIVMVARSNRLSDLLLLVPQLQSALDTAVAGQVTRVGSPEP